MLTDSARQPQFPGRADAVTTESFERGLISEQSGPEAEVMKLLPPLVIDDETLADGFRIIRESLSVVLPQCLDTVEVEARQVEREPVAV